MRNVGRDAEKLSAKARNDAVRALDKAFFVLDKVAHKNEASSKGARRTSLIAVIEQDPRGHRQEVQPVRTGKPSQWHAYFTVAIVGLMLPVHPMLIKSREINCTRTQAT